jgi:hypothetical protein
LFNQQQRTLTMQEPEIFEQPLTSKEAEAPAVGEGNTWHSGPYSGFHNNVTENSTLTDFDDFAPVPEGWFRDSFDDCFLCMIWIMTLTCSLL